MSGRVPWAAPQALGPHTLSPGRLRCCCFEGQVSPADTLELVFLPEALKIPWTSDTGTWLPTALPSCQAWGQPSAPGDRGRPAPVLLLSTEMMAVPGRNVAVPGRNAVPAAVGAVNLPFLQQNGAQWGTGMAQMLPYLGLAPGGPWHFGERPRTGPGGWESSSPGTSSSHDPTEPHG